MYESITPTLEARRGIKIKPIQTGDRAINTRGNNEVGKKTQIQQAKRNLVISQNEQI